MIQDPATEQSLLTPSLVLRLCLTSVTLASNLVTIYQVKCAPPGITFLMLVQMFRDVYLL